MVDSAARLFYGPIPGGGVAVRFEREGKLVSAFVLPSPEHVYRLAAAMLRVADAVHGGAGSGSVEA